MTKDKDTYISYNKLFLLYLAGCVAGVIIEGTFCLLTKGHWENHVVSILGYFNVLYGFGTVLLYVGAVKLRKKNMAVRVLSMTIAATLLELMSGLLLRDGLGMRAWNYDNKFMNYQGLICLSFSSMWGIAAFVVCIIYPHMNTVLNKLQGKKWNMFCIILGIIMVVDFSLTGMSIMRWSERHYGVNPMFGILKVLDDIAPDDWMQARFIE